MCIRDRCDIDHPTQCMADMLHIIHEFGGVENLKGKKLAMTWAYSPSYGKPLSVPQGGKVIIRYTSLLCLSSVSSLRLYKIWQTVFK